MGTFVTSNTALPSLKQDAYPPSGLTTELDAADINNLWSAAGDLRSHVRGWVNVMEYGADPTGVSSSTTAVAQAYAALVAAGGGTLFFPPGTYLMNLTVVDRNIQIVGSGKSANGIVNQYEGGSGGATILKPQDLTKPVLQIGDGTAKVNAITVSNLTVFGDGATATSDGIYQLGAHRVTYSDITVENFGRDNISITSSATQPSFYTHLVSVHSNNAVRTNLRMVYGPLWVTTIWLTGCSIQSTSVTPTWLVYVEGVNFTSVNSWFETPTSGHGVYMRYDSQTSTVPPFWNGGGSISGGGTTTLDSPNSTDILVDIDLVGTAFNHRTSTIYVQGVAIDGQIKWDVDATVVSMKGTYPNRITGAIEILGPLAFNGNLNDSRDEQSSPTTRILQGGGSAGNEFLALTGAALQIPGAAATGLSFATNGGRIWKSANGMLRFIPSGTPSADTQGISATPHRQAVTYSASMTIDVTLGTWAYIAATNGTAFTINAPTSGGAPLSNLTDQRITITVSNQSGGALGAATWNATFKMAAWTQPANGFSRSIDFQYDGTNWIEITRATADVPN